MSRKLLSLVRFLSILILFVPGQITFLENNLYFDPTIVVFSENVTTQFPIVASIPVGNGPFGVAVNPVTNRIYVTNSTDDTVSVIDGETNNVIATIPVRSSPQNIAVNPETNKIYVVNRNFGSPSSVIDGATNIVITEIPISPNPWGIGVNPTTNRIYIAANGLHVIDGNTDTIITTVPEPYGYSGGGLTVNPKTNTVYLTSPGISVFDGNTNEFIATILNVPKGDYIEVNPETNLVYTVNNGYNASFVIIDGSINQISDTIPFPNGDVTFPQALAVNPTTNHIFVTDYNGTVYVFDGAANTFFQDPIIVNMYLKGIAINPTNNRVYVADSLNNRVVVIEDFKAPVLDLPFDYPTRGSDSGFAGLFFREAFLDRTTSVFDHTKPLNYKDNKMLSYLGYPEVEDSNPGWPEKGTIDCGPPNIECYDGHEGYDFSRDKTGDYAYAAAPGKIITARWKGCYGKTVEIDHGYGFKTLYGHLDSISVITGTIVTRTTQLGVIGRTTGCGTVTGPHLHFGVYYNGTYFDPSGWIDSAIDPWAITPGGMVSSNLWRFSAPRPESWGVNSQVGGKFTSSSGSTVIGVPPGAFNGMWNFTLTDVPVAEPSASLESTGHSFSLSAQETQLESQWNTGQLLSIDLGQWNTDALTLTLPITITINYTDTEIVDLDESSLRLYRWNEQDSSWTQLVSSLDTLNNTATAKTDELGLFGLFADDNDTEGPLVGKPMFSSTVNSFERLTVTVPINDISSGSHGVDYAFLRFGNTTPYTQTVIAGISPGGTGDGTWVFSIPPQGLEWEESILKFSIEAKDGDGSPETSVNNNDNAYFTVTVLVSKKVYLPIINLNR